MASWYIVQPSKDFLKITVACKDPILYEWETIVWYSKSNKAGEMLKRMAPRPVNLHDGGSRGVMCLSRRRAVWALSLGDEW